MRKNQKVYLFVIGFISTDWYLTFKVQLKAVNNIFYNPKLIS